MADQDLNFNIAISTQKRNDQSVQGNPNPAPQKPSTSDEEVNNAANNQKGESITSLIKNSAHPGVCLFTIGFKIASITCFIFLDIFLSSEALSYLVVIIIGSADFWMTKNISGRILVGLRWWNEVKEDGQEVWIFESKNEKKEHGGDATVFWTSLYVNAGVWLALFIWDVIRLKFVWGIIAFILLVFAGTNLYGYVKCSKEQQASIMKFGTKAVLKAAEKGADVAKNQV